MSAALRDKIQYKFIVGTALKLKPNSFDPSSNEVFYYTDSTEENANAYIFTEHQIRFSVRMSNKNSDVNSATIILSNLPDDVINYVKTQKDNHIIGALYAGDNVTGLGLISSGEITKISDVWDGGVRNTTFTIQDGSAFIKNSFTSRKFTTGVLKNEIIKDIAKDLHLPIAKFADITGSIKSPKTYFGKTYDILKSLLDPEGYRCNIYNGEVVIIPLKARTEQEASYISRDSGLIGKVSSEVNNIKNSSVNGEDNSGIKFSCLLDHVLKPDETVYIKDEVSGVDGAYKLSTVNFKGDFEGNEWVSDCVAVKVDKIVSIEKIS